MAGLTDDEYGWEPVPDCRSVRAVGDGTFRSDGRAEAGDPKVFTTLSWRLAHIASVLAADRNAVWLGTPPTDAERDGDPGTAADALAALEAGYDTWRAFVLHILDELIHHGAEAALLRDLYAAQTSMAELFTRSGE